MEKIAPLEKEITIEIGKGDFSALLTFILGKVAMNLQRQNPTTGEVIARIGRDALNKLEDLLTDEPKLGKILERRTVDVEGSPTEPVIGSPVGDGAASDTTRIVYREQPGGPDPLGESPTLLPKNRQ